MFRRISTGARIIRMLILPMLLLLSSGCGKEQAEPECVVTLAAGGRVKTLDPALADDLASRNMVAALYDTLLEYDYVKRPYQLIPSMLQAMPEISEDGLEYRFRLRDDLFFSPDKCFGGEPRRVTADDVLYSFKRIADSRVHSPAYWMFRGKIAGINDFYAESLTRSGDDATLYEMPVAGLRKIDDLAFSIRLTRPDPRFLCILALPNTAVVPREAVAFYGETFAVHPVGSGAFTLADWVRDCRLELKRNPHYRKQLFAGAQSPADRTRALPLADRVICYQVRQPFAAWLLFLQGEIDVSVLDKDNLDLVAGGDTVAPALLERGVELLKAPEFEIRYIGFNFRDPLMQNEKLRQAISLAFDVGSRIRHMNNLMLKVHGPIPPGVAGYDPGLVNEWLSHDLDRARKLLAEAGYPGGIDPATGEALTLDFDQGNNTAAQRQIGELMASDLAQCGIKLNSILNSTPRFIEKLRQGQTQLFRYSWVGDYPDAENFLQLFYSGNIGGCNRAAFSDPVFDRMYERAIRMADTPERSEHYRKMAEYVTGRTPWIFEGIPIAYQLKYTWLENYWPHDFAFSRWKYLNVRAGERQKRRAGFKPLDFSELRGR